MRFLSLRFATVLTATLLTCICILPAHAQSDKKKKKDQPQPTDTKDVPLLNDEQQIDYAISGMLGAWQVGDVERMHKYYADDVSVVNGGWAPPIIGWAKYVTLYQQQRARMKQVRLDRDNTYIKVNGNTGWACYQWDFTGTFDDTPSAARGQTTLIFEKRNGQWVIVHDHTSVIDKSQGAPTAAPVAPGSQPQGNKPPSP